MIWLAMIGCGEELFSVSVQQSAETVIAGVADLPSAAPPEDLSIDDWLDVLDGTSLGDQGVQPGDITRASLTKLSVEVLVPEEQDLTFVQSLELWIAADGLEDVLLATGGPFDAGQRAADLVLEEVDLAEYALAGGGTINTVAVGLPPADDTTLRATIGLEVGISANSLVSRLTER